MARKSREPATAASADGPDLASVKSFACQLQDLDLERAVASPYDLVIIDYSRDGTDEGRLSAADLARLKVKPDGRRRIVVAYMSIGEAENYRYYWHAAWATAQPAWLIGENPEWPGNFSVRFWDEGWQRLLVGSTNAYLDRLLAVGFDGMYLDKCDVFEDIANRFPEIAGTRPDLEADMVALITRLSSYAKARQPGFLTVVPNAESLLTDGAALDAIDAVAKEELVYGIEQPESRNSKADFNEAKKGLARAVKAGKPVLVFEYLDDPAKIKETQALVASLGYLLYVSDASGSLNALDYA